jgi:hypothetical protein
VPAAEEKSGLALVWPRFVQRSDQFLLRTLQRVNFMPAKFSGAPRISNELERIGDLDSVAWENLRASSASGTGLPVPRLLRFLLNAGSEAQRFQAVTELEWVLSTGQRIVFEAAPYAIPFVLHIASHTVDVEVKAAAFWLLERMAGGEAHKSEIRAGNTDLTRRLAEEIGKGIGLYYKSIDTPRCGPSALELIYSVEGRSPRLLKLMRRLEARDDDPSIMRTIAEIRGYDEDGR